MARENVDGLIDDLYKYADDISKIPQGNKLTTYIIGLEQLANDSITFGGKIAQICPAKIREQKELLESTLQQVTNACKTVKANLDGLSEMLENMPLKDLRGTTINPEKAKAQLETSMGIDGNGVGAQEPVRSNIQTGEVNDGPKSAMLQQQESSIWDSLKGHFRFSEGLKTGFDWNRISENVDSLGIDVSATTEAPKMGLFESIMSNGGIPKSAGDLNSKPDPRDAYDYNSEYADVLPGEIPHFAESNEPVVEEPTVMQRMTESVELPSKPQNMEDQGKEIFATGSAGGQSLKEALASFKGDRDFDFDDIEMSLDDGMSLEGHIID